MKIHAKCYFLITMFIANTTIFSDQRISFFLRPFPHLPELAKNLTTEQMHYKSKKLHNPRKAAKYTLRSVLAKNTASGIFCTYMGQLSVSDTNGEVCFARRQESPHLRLLITEKIDPVLMEGQTVHHWEIEAGVPAKLYLVEQRDDPETEIEFWNVRQIELPESKHIELDTIVIFAKPKYVVVPRGITIVKKEAQLLLPDIYVKKNIDKISSAFYVLNLKRFFSQTQQMYQVDEKKYSSIIQ